MKGGKDIWASLCFAKFEVTNREALIMNLSINIVAFKFYVFWQSETWMSFFFLGRQTGLQCVAALLKTISKTLEECRIGQEKWGRHGKYDTMKTYNRRDFTERPEKESQRN